jgi:hypothetical protein
MGTAGNRPYGVLGGARICFVTSRFATLAIDAVDPAVVAEFWCAVLGWRILDDDPDGGPPIGCLHRLSLVTVPNAPIRRGERGGCAALEESRRRRC